MGRYSYLIIGMLILVVLISSCAKVLKEPEKVLKESEKKLDDLHIVACEEADKAGTCQTRLIEVGIVMPEECCEVLGKCCG